MYSTPHYRAAEAAREKADYVSKQTADCYVNECAPTPALILIQQRLNDINDRLSIHVERLDAAMDRIAGTTPCDTISGNGSISPAYSGFVDQANDALDHSERLVNRLSGVLERVMRVA